jgi:hypothetical protein
VNRIDILPDDVLLEIFYFYMIMNSSRRSWLDPLGGKKETEAWQSLVHVCQRWRSLVFQSPRYLNLQLFCTSKSPTRDALDVWPALPLIVASRIFLTVNHNDNDNLNVIAALEQSNRVCEVSLLDSVIPGSVIPVSQLEKVLAPMHVPFPELTDLRIVSYDETLPVIPDSFLGGSAPRLQHFELKGIPFPGFPKLLLSATHLVHLRLLKILRFGFIPPEAMVALLSVLSNLDTLELDFNSQHSFRDWEIRSLPPPNRSILPALDKFNFKGIPEYLEDLITCIDAPQLKYFSIKFFCQIDFDTPRLAEFINRTPKLSKRDVHVLFHSFFAGVELPAGSGTLEISIPYFGPHQQLSSIEQFCNSSLPPLSTVENLYIENQYPRPGWNNDAIQNLVWLEFLLPFTAVKDLYLSKEFAPGIAAALQEVVGGRITEVFPIIRNIFVEGLEPSGPFQENIEQFVTARQLSDRPIAISVWDKDSNMEPI